MGLEEEALLDDIRLCVILKAQCSSGVAVLVYRGERNAAGGERVADGGERNVDGEKYIVDGGDLVTDTGSVESVAGV